MQSQKQRCFLTHDMNSYDMSCHDIGHDTCYDNAFTTCYHDMRRNCVERKLDNVRAIVYDSGSEVNSLPEREQLQDTMLSKTDWWYLVNTLTSWRVFAPRAVIKKNPQLAWRIMNLCKDPGVRVKGAYFTTCFRRELAKLENAEKLEYWRNVARQKFGVA